MIPVAGPWITDLEVEYVADAVRSAWYDGAGGFVARFEECFAQYVDRRFAVSLPSCTSGIHLSLLALGVGPGDEVIVPDITWIATAAPISYVGATPVFTDVDPSNWCLSPATVEANITERTRAIIPVDLYGAMPDMDGICNVASRYGLACIEDAAEAFGSTYGGRRAGSFGDTSVFSFHGSKTLTTGEGGMVVTDDERLRDRILVLRDHGRSPGDTSFQNNEVGHKYKMSDLQAALGLAQLERADDLIGRKRSIFSWYEERIRDRKDAELNPRGEGNEFVPWMVTAILSPGNGATKEEVRDELSRRSIATRPFFNPLSSLPAYRQLEGVAEARAKNVVSHELSRCGLNLPSALSLTPSDVDAVVGALLEVLDSEISAPGDPIATSAPRTREYRNIH